MKKWYLSVGDLIAELQTLDPALPVHTEGCDCVGAASGVEEGEEYEQPIVIIGRMDSPCETCGHDRPDHKRPEGASYDTPEPCTLCECAEMEY